MIKLDSVANKLETIRERIEARIEELDEKKEALEDRACDADRGLTAREQNSWDRYDEEQSELESELQDIEGCLDYIRDWCVDY